MLADEDLQQPQLVEPPEWWHGIESPRGVTHLLSWPEAAAEAEAETEASPPPPSVESEAARREAWYRGWQRCTRARCSCGGIGWVRGAVHYSPLCQSLHKIQRVSSLSVPVAARDGSDVVVTNENQTMVPFVPCTNKHCACRGAGSVSTHAWFATHAGAKRARVVRLHLWEGCACTRKIHRVPVRNLPDASSFSPRPVNVCAQHHHP